jgi:hypothetical protein
MSRALLKFVESVCVQDAWYWAASEASNNGFGKTYGTPELIKCRWDDKVELIRASNGEEITSSAQILVVQDVEVDSYIQLAEPGDTTPPSSINDAWMIRRIDKNPLFRATDQFVRVVYV